MIRILAALAVLVLPAAAAAGEPDAETIVLNAVGDIAHPNGGPFMSQIDEKKHRLFDEVKPLLSRGDLNFANIECPITAIKPTARKTYAYKCEPFRVKYVLDAGFNLISLANNHALDCGDRGIGDTLANIEKLGKGRKSLWWAGVGRSNEEALGPRIITVPGKTSKVAFFAVSSGAGNGLVDGLHHPTLHKRIAAAVKDADIVLVSVHYGPEYVHLPDAGTVTKYHALIDAGADAVIAHHPHVVQGIEHYKGKVIFYSLGNFSFGSRTFRHYETGARLYGMLAQLVFKGGDLASAKVYPVYANNTDPWTVEGQTLKPVHAVPQLLRGVFAREALREFQDFSARVPGASPTRLRVDGDLAVIEPR